MNTILIEILKVEHLINFSPTKQDSHGQNEHNQQQPQQEVPYR
jgi:hypothetical protein